MKSNEKFTQRAEIAIEKARQAAGELGHSYIGTEHLLLGILGEQEGLGARILRRRGLEEEPLRRCVVRADARRGAPGLPPRGCASHARRRGAAAGRRPPACIRATSVPSTCFWGS